MNIVQVTLATFQPLRQEFPETGVEGVHNLQPRSPRHKVGRGGEIPVLTGCIMHNFRTWPYYSYTVCNRSRSREDLLCNVNFYSQVVTVR